MLESVIGRVIVSPLASVEVVDVSLTAIVEVLSDRVVLLAGADVVTADDAVVEFTEPLLSPVHAAIAASKEITNRRAALDPFTNTLNAHEAPYRKGPNTLRDAPSRDVTLPASAA